ncbi:hypothetical protein SDC9_118088 [bioreactor metagenome]|uniref:Uncharacterized protein n=1 Tax=bioreactor metagenome TaxID=1076179 RepID=A0A645C0R2_9ZZZZ
MGIETLVVAQKLPAFPERGRAFLENLVAKGRKRRLVGQFVAKLTVAVFHKHVENELQPYDAGVDMARTRKIDILNQRANDFPHVFIRHDIQIQRQEIRRLAAGRVQRGITLHNGGTLLRREDVEPGFDLLCQLRVGEAGRGVTVAL